MILRDLAHKIYRRICYSLENKRILYVGVNRYGKDKANIKHLEETNKEVISIDKSPMVAEYGAEHHYCWDITELMPFPENYFDAIIMLGVIGYGLDNKEEIFKAFDRLKTYLKPEGKIYFDVSRDGEYK